MRYSSNCFVSSRATQSGRVGEVLGADVERLEQAVRGLEKDAGDFARGGGEEIALAPAALHRQEAAVEKCLRGKAAADERGEDGARAGKDGVGQAALDAGAEQAVAGIADAGQAGVGDDGDVFPGGEFLDEFGGAARFVVLVVADERLRDFEMAQQISRVAGVFAGDEVDAFQRPPARGA